MKWTPYLDLCKCQAGTAAPPRGQKKIILIFELPNKSYVLWQCGKNKQLPNVVLSVCFHKDIIAWQRNTLFTYIKSGIIRVSCISIHLVCCSQGWAFFIHQTTAAAILCLLSILLSFYHIYNNTVYAKHCMNGYSFFLAANSLLLFTLSPLWVCMIMEVEDMCGSFQSINTFYSYYYLVEDSKSFLTK